MNNPSVPNFFQKKRDEREAWFAPSPDPDAIAIVSPTRMRKALEDASNRQEVTIEQFLKTSCYRKLIRVSSKTPERLEAMRTDFPHFGAVIDFYRRVVSLNLRGKSQYLSAPAILLNGPPGIGKTRFATCLARVFGAEYHEISCSTVTASFVLSGNTPSWSDSKPGKVFESMRVGKTANPIILIDEIDKLGGDYRYDGFGPLYGLLEKTTARRFEDENFGMPMDCSHILWVGTSNELIRIPDPILSRLRVFEIQPPSGKQLRNVLRSIYKAILEENPDWSRSFSDKLPDEVIDQLDGASPRALKQILLEACGNAALRSRGKPDCVLTVTDLSDATPNQRRAIGFIQ